MSTALFPAVALNSRIARLRAGAPTVGKEVGRGEGVFPFGEGAEEKFSSGDPPRSGAPPERRPPAWGPPTVPAFVH